MVSESVVHISQLTRRFGDTTALASVSLSMLPGAVYGLVGANGAGKTTLIKHVLGLLRPESGSVRVFGLDPVADPVGVLSRIGYLSEENDLPGWMRVDDLIHYSRAFYPSWDDAYAEDLRRTFALEASATVKTLSKGQKARLGLLVALAYRPELLVLDEPSSGLDPIVRRDIVGAVIRTTAEEGRTVLFSSHLLDEVEEVADHVTMIDCGRVLVSESLNAIKESHRVDGRVPSLNEISRCSGRAARFDAGRLTRAFARRRHRLVVSPPAPVGTDGHRGRRALASGAQAPDPRARVPPPSRP
jgi:ABC-2 type transport system ATP-binding protein